MPSQRFDFVIPVASDPNKCWEVLTDVPRVASWVTILYEVNELARLERYSAVLLDRVGPFKLKADLDVTVSEVEQGARIRVHASGEDRQVASRIAIDATLTIESGAELPTLINVVGTYEVVGRVATLGAGMIKQKADKIIHEFTSMAAAALGGA